MLWRISGWWRGLVRRWLRVGTGRGRGKIRFGFPLRGLEPLAERVLLAADFGEKVPWTTGGLPPSESAMLVSRQLAAQRNHRLPADVDGDRQVAPRDGLLLVNAIRQALHASDEAGSWEAYLDVDGDGVLTDQDFLAYLAAVHHQGWSMDAEYGGHGAAAWAGSGVSAGEAALAADASGVQGTSLDAWTTLESFGADALNSYSGSSYGDSYDDGGEENEDEPESDPPNEEPYPAPPPDCHASLASTTVNESQQFTLPLEFSESCFTTYRVDWGDGLVDTFDADEAAEHRYWDDNPSGTPQDDYLVVVNLWGDGASEMPGESRQLTATVTVRNLPPTAEPDSGIGFLTDEDTPFTTSSVLSNDDDPSFFDAISLQVAGLDTTQTKGTVSYAGGGRFHYDPNGQFDCLAEGETATDTFLYWMHDDDDPGALRSAVATVEIVGRPEQYWVDYGGAGLAEEDGQRESKGVFRLTPPARCGSVFVAYRPVAYDGPLVLAEAEEADFAAPPRGVVEFKEGTAYAEVTFTPVDDHVIEENEWFFFTVDPASVPEFHVVPTAENAYFRIDDNEWRFVSESRALTSSIGPRAVEAFTSPLSTGYLDGSMNYNAAFNSRIGSQLDSSATATASASSQLTRPGNGTDFAYDQLALKFVCDSQTGDIWRMPVTKSGDIQDGPLATGLGMNYSINDVGDLEAYLVVDFQVDIVAGGTISKAETVGISAGIGAKDKAVATGRIDLTTQVTYAGGYHYREGNGFTFLCMRGAQ